MKRWIMLVAILSSVLAIGFTARFVAMRHDREPHIATQAEIDAFTTAYCDAERHGLPLPSPGEIHMEGGFTLGAIDCADA
jgi:hypothetical protein